MICPSLFLCEVYYRVTLEIVKNLIKRGPKYKHVTHTVWYHKVLAISDRRGLTPKEKRDTTAAMLSTSYLHISTLLSQFA